MATLSKTTTIFVFVDEEFEFDRLADNNIERTGSIVHTTLMADEEHRYAY